MVLLFLNQLSFGDQNYHDASRPLSVHYFSNKKAWMNSDIMGSILQRLDRRMNQEKRKVILFWDNATCHPETAQTGLKNIKLVFLPKNMTSRLQPLDAGIIRNFKCKYRKLLVRYIVSRIDEGKTASQIIEEVHVLKAITWLKTACKKVVPDTTKHCFKKCGFDVGNISVVNEEIDTEFQQLFSQISDETTIDEHIDFDFETITSEPVVNTQYVDWRQESREKSIAQVIHLEDVALSVNESGDEADEADEGKITLTVSVALQSLDGVNNCIENHGDNEVNMMLNDLIGRFEKLKLKILRRTNITSFLKK